jgi:CYTH domain-containing protein
MTIDPQIAANFGFPKPEYTSVERERRWLCRQVPHGLVYRTEVIVDLYVTGARLRLREARPTDGAAPMLRLSRKADVDKHTRLITSIYLPEDEFSVLAASLPGSRIKKHRHRLYSTPGVMLLVDEFQGELEGLFIVEAEFKTQEQLEAFEMPAFAVCEVTDDPKFTGGYLVKNGLPEGLQRLVRQ